MSWSQQDSPDLGSDSLLAESAQLRSTLQAKTYLQALSPDERRRLLKGTKVSGHRRKHHTSVVAAAAARRDELQQLLEQEKNRVIGDQAVLAQQADVSYSSRPAAHETAAWETARLRVRATSMAAENDALKSHVAQLMHQISNMDRSVQVVSNEARARSQRMTEAAAARIAELEDQVERQQRALSEMAAASEELARDNCTVSDEIVQLREDKASQAQNMDALQDRVAKLQELYMRDLDQSKAITVHEGIQQSSLLQLATPQMLALSQPPADFRLEEDARSTRIVPALHEIEGLSRERKILKDQVKSKSEKLACAERAYAELNTQLTAERRAAKQAGAGAQKQLLGSMRRIQYMVSKAKDGEAAMQQKDAYIRKLEARLLNQHKAPANKAKSGAENSKVGSGGIRRSSPGTAKAASKQDQPSAASSASHSHSGTKHSEAAQPQHFSYQAFPQPLQDTSNLPSNVPFSHQHRPASAPPHKPSTAQELWQNSGPSRSSSDCFSMDPAQLEADIAALTSAIAADSAAEGLSRHPHHMDHVSSHVGPANDDTGAAHQDELYQERYQGRMHLQPEFQTSTWGMQPERQQPWHQNGRSDGKAHGQVASARAVPAGPAARSGHVHDQPVSLDGQDDQRVAQYDSWDLRDAEVSVGGDEQVWHGRQSKDERLADAAESRLLGLASKPSGAVPSTQQDLEPRHHQPISYARRGDQAALHNLAMHDDSPPSSTSQQSVASSLRSIDHSAPITSITANECFDGAALFATASSASLHPVGLTSPSPQIVPEAAQASTAVPKVYQLQQQVPDDADSIQRMTMARLTGQGMQAELQHAKQNNTTEQCQHPHLLHQQLPRPVSQEVPAELPQQQFEEVSSQRSLAQNRLQRPAQLPAESPSQEAVQSQQAPQLQHGSGLPASASGSRDVSGEELMTMQELEARIASLNKTLLRAPKGLQSPEAACSHAVRTRRGRCQLDLVDHQQSGVINCHASASHNHAIEAQDAGQADRPAMTAWQKLTRQRPAPAASSGSSPSSQGSQGGPAARCGAVHIESPHRSPQTMRGRGVQAAPLESPPSTGMRHYSAASKHRSEDWDGSDCRLLDWAASCPQGDAGQIVTCDSKLEAVQ
ncbi:MAG: hypothetical protein FRX49_01365 [Trebouxia sp. A1-2]|nr:MAG: hypothetical protein FRX49_01365 [Trebouxia sp. A1-2]